MTTTTVPTTAPKPSLADLAAGAKADRNRAIDLYRVVAMLAVAIGHWLAMVAMEVDGEMIGGNALEFVPALSSATWALQVMPLFFVVGGFSSAMSLDAHARSDGRPQDWIAARLRRMLPPAVALASTWLVAIAVASAFGQFSLAVAGAHAAAIPLWFLANYTIDTALAPFVLPRFRRNPLATTGAIIGTFLFFEYLRILDVPVLPQVNWVLGWLAFQMLGMAWRDGLIPTGSRLIGMATAAWIAALGLVLSGGPWAISMVNAPGMENSPTNPPTLSLLVFGTAYSLTAIALAPKLSSILARSPRLWAGVVAANAVAMSVYLWHMTAAVIVTALMFVTIGLPAAAVGSVAWWLWKLPIIAASIFVLAPIVAYVSRIERAALLAPRRPWNGGITSILGVATLTSVALKLWTGGTPATIVGSCLVLVALGSTVFRVPSTQQSIELG